MHQKLTHLQIEEQNLVNDSNVSGEHTPINMGIKRTLPKSFKINLAESGAEEIRIEFNLTHSTFDILNVLEFVANHHTASNNAGNEFKMVWEFCCIEVTFDEDEYHHSQYFN